MIQSWQSFAYGVIAAYVFSVVVVVLAFGLPDLWGRLLGRGRHAPNADARTEPGERPERVMEDIRKRQAERDAAAIERLIEETRVHRTE